MSYHISFTTEFRRNTYGGLFIALEGLDGSGKTIQLEPLKEYFDRRKRQVVFARAPRKDEGILATVHKDILQQKRRIPRAAFQYLFTADYIIQNEDIIIPALKKNSIVITDRFVGWSAVPYGLLDQHSGMQPEVARSILAAHGVFTKMYQLVIPDLSFFLDVSVRTALIRLSRKGEEEIYEDQASLIKVRDGYTWLLNEFPEEFVRIDAERSIEAVTKDMLQVIEKKTKK